MGTLHCGVVEQEIDGLVDSGGQAVDAGVIGDVERVDHDVMGLRERVELGRRARVAAGSEYAPAVGGVAFGEAEAEAFVGAGDEDGGHGVFLRVVW